MTITKAGTDTRNLLFLSRGAAPVAAAGMRIFT